MNADVFFIHEIRAIRVIRGFISCQQGVEQAVGPRDGEGEEGRDPQVEGDGGGDCRQVGQHAHHQVAEIVVGDGIAREPGVVGREAGGPEDSVEKGDLHPLLPTRRLNAGHIGPDDAPEGEGQGEEEFYAGRMAQGRMVQGWGIRVVGAGGAGEEPHGPAGQGQQEQGRHDPARGVRQPSEDGEDPEEIPAHHQPQRAGEGVAPTGHPAEEAERQRQHGQADQLQGQIPADRGDHKKTRFSSVCKRALRAGHF